MKMVNFFAALIISGFVFISESALADTYQVTFGWIDSTSYIPSDAPVYEAKYRVAGGAEVVLPLLSLPAGTVIVTANPGEPIDVSGQVTNLDLSSGWMPWVTATAPHPVTQPEVQTNMSITVVRTGP